MTDSVHPKTPKSALEQLVKQNGGALVHSATASPNVLCIADRRLVSVASLIKKNDHSLIRPAWLLDCVAQASADAPRPPLLLPLEGARHLFHATDDAAVAAEAAVDEWGDSYTRDVADGAELEGIFGGMPDRGPVKSEGGGAAAGLLLLAQAEEHDGEMSSLLIDAKTGGDVKGWLFRGLRVWFVGPMAAAASREPEAEMRMYVGAQVVRFAGGVVAEGLEEEGVTQVVVAPGTGGERVREVRERVARRRGLKVPRVVGVEWVEESWREGTVLDEERFQVVG